MTPSPRADGSGLARLGTVVFALQAVALLVVTHRRHASYNLSFDYAIFYQAWWAIGNGDLDPHISVLGYPYWQSHLELVMWPLAALALVDDSGLLLLWAQALASVGALAVAYSWLLRVLRDRAPGEGLPAPLVAVAALVLLVGNPWVYLSAVEDFHLQAVAALFLTLTARELWTTRRRRVWAWAALTLLTGDVAGSYLLGLGLSALAFGRGRRLHGVALAVAGVAWVVLAAVLGSGRGSGLHLYGWVTGTTAEPGDVGGALAIAGSMLTSPGTVLDALLDRAAVGQVENLLPTGVLGLAHPAVLGVCLVVLAANLLHLNPSFLHPTFQYLPVYVLAPLGTVLLLERAGRVRSLRVPAGLLLTVTVAAAGLFAARQVAEPSPLFTGFRVDAATADQLAALHESIPDDAQVVATWGVVGRFADREAVQALLVPGREVPLQAGPTVLVLAPDAGNQPVPDDLLDALEAEVRALPGARPLLETDQVTALAWEVPPGGGRLVVPG